MVRPPAGAVAVRYSGGVTDRKPLRDPIVDEHVLREGKAYSFVELTLRQQDGSTRPKPIVRHSGAALVVPVIEQPGRSPKIVFVVNDRHTINERLLELPAGCIDSGETPEETAARELQEETGYQATSLYPLERFYTTPGLTDELMHTYVGTGLNQVGQNLEADESLEVRVLTSTEVGSLLERGELMDGKTILALMAAHRRGYVSL